MDSGRPLGRPPGAGTLCTPAVTQAICDRLEIAVPEKWAAEENGVSESIFYRWLRLGQQGQEPYSAFFAAVTRAKAKCVANLHVQALGGGKGSSQATWMLERRFWREYAEHKRVEISPPDPLAAMSEADLEEAIADQKKRVADYERVRGFVSLPPIGTDTEGE